jgi:hypothetical protein
MIPDLQERYRGYFSPYIQLQIDAVTASFANGRSER